MCAILANVIIKFIRALSFTLAFFGFAGWVYIAENAAFHPVSLTWPLTHLAPYPREDVFGVICFAVSFVAMLVYRYLKEDDKKR